MPPYVLTGPTSLDFLLGVPSCLSAFILVFPFAPSAMFLATFGGAAGALPTHEILKSNMAKVSAHSPIERFVSLPFFFHRGLHGGVKNNRLEGDVKMLHSSTLPDLNQKRNGRTTIYVIALDNIVSVNSLYAFAVFIGLSWNPIDSRNTTNTLISNPACTPPLRLAENIITFQVYSFSSFLFTTLLALSLKQSIRISTTFQV
ncbi:hypothetical protein Syun_019907 [Stephania yunnanensis]|uniref:Uncharacterized protein n=1 Tax=Stephania yunnanensis TaxID=152371 RepID=A0AAP0NYE3_9MAGN